MNNRGMQSLIVGICEMIEENLNTVTKDLFCIFATGTDVVCSHEIDFLTTHLIFWEKISRSIIWKKVVN